MTDETGEVNLLQVKYKRSPDYKTYYAQGVQGGIVGSHHFRMDFYRDDIPSTAGSEEDGRLVPEGDIVSREIDVSVYLSLASAKQLRDWVDRHIKDHEERFGEIKIVGEPGPKQEEVE